jgi:hypothetical protein
MDKTEVLHILREYMRENAAELGICGIGVFGSTARDEASESSDIDVVVDIDPPRFLTLARIQRDLEHRFGKRIDLIRRRKDMNSFLRRCMEEDAVYA